MNTRSSPVPSVKSPYPGPKTAEILRRVRENEGPADCTFIISDDPVVEERGEGVFVYDPDGNVFLDFMAGFGVVNTGHCHPRVVAAIQEQATKFWHIMGAANPIRTDLEELLTRIAPGTGKKKVLFGNSGSEAVEIALKLAKVYTKKTEIITFWGSFHGRSQGALSIMSKLGARRGLYPMVPGGVFVPYPYCYRCPFGQERSTCSLTCAKYIEQILTDPATGVSEPATIIIEAVQGNGGMTPAPDDFMAEMRRICTERGLVFIVDEVMSGFGRTGKLFASQHSGVDPDVTICGKAISASLPLSAVIAKAAITDVWDANREGSTFSGNPISCAASFAAINVYLDEKLADNARDMGVYLLEGLESLKAEFPVIGDVRGRGLMAGIEFVKDRATKEPLTNCSRRVADLALRKGLLTYPNCGHYNNVVGLLPPLVLDRGHVDTFVQIMRGVIGKFQGEVR